MNKSVILHMPCVALAALLTVPATAANLVPEGKRDFDVPFKGAGQMSLVYTPVFFQKGTAGVVVSGEAKWSDVVRGEKNFLVDSSHLEPERYLIPALAELGMKPGDINWLLCTHVHGDHIGGHHSLHEKYGVKVATLDSTADALRDHVKVAIRVRTHFPKNSPPPQSYLKGVEPDKLLAEGELLEGRLCAIAAPGHDDDCLVWIDTKTGTAFTGDSLQANGTVCQGIAFYRDLAAYRQTLAKLAKENIENIVCGHDYDGIGSVLRGKANVAAALRYSEERVKLYAERIAAYLKDGVPVESEPVSLAEKLIREVGCGVPEKLFLALHTVSEHLKELGHDG